MTARTLSDIMEFEHVIRVQDGQVFDSEHGNPWRVDGVALYAPECIYEGFGDEQHIEPGTGWQLLEGYTGQHGYSGPVMHASEYIGGCMERDILALDGYYVALVCSVLSDDPDDDDPAGWCVAYRPLDTATAGDDPMQDEAVCGSWESGDLAGAVGALPELSAVIALAEGVAAGAKT